MNNILAQEDILDVYRKIENIKLVLLMPCKNATLLAKMIDDASMTLVSKLSNGNKSYHYNSKINSLDDNYFTGITDKVAITILKENLAKLIAVFNFVCTHRDDTIAKNNKITGRRELCHFDYMKTLYNIHLNCDGITKKLKETNCSV